MKKNKTIAPILLAGVLGMFLGWMLFGESQLHEHPVPQQAESTAWTCSMHPQIRQPEPGNCPLCGMDLIPLVERGEEVAQTDLRMSATAMQLANVQTTVLKKELPSKTTLLSGRIAVNEKRMFTQASHLPGRVERLMVTYPGETVRHGQVLAYVYSPELILAQEELLEAARIKDLQPSLFGAAKKKLESWKLTAKQIEKILSKGEANEQFPILADVNGVVLENLVKQGDYIRQGQPLLRVADLSDVWVQFDVYENDIAWVRKGNEVEFQVQSMPGETFTGKITFVDPFMNPNTRVAEVRLVLKNPGGRFKPDMLVSGLVKSELDNSEPEMIIPKSALMWTGPRSVVYVRKTSYKGTVFTMREVTLGHALGDTYIIESGLVEGEEIATHGTFSIDAAAQLAGKPSMMNPYANEKKVEGLKAEISDSFPRIQIGSAAKVVLHKVFSAYFDLKNALVNTDLSNSKAASKRLQAEMKQVDMKLFEGMAHITWMKAQETVLPRLEKMVFSSDINALRIEFKPVSTMMVALAQSMRPLNQPVYVQYCPMADGNRGGSWLSRESAIMNPYFGDAMLKCGEITQEIK